jgi:hypothetical protein
MWQFLRPVLCFCLILTVSLAANPEECLIIGGTGNPAQAEALFQQALIAWQSGNPTVALQQFEAALIADRSVLAHDDQGMGKALIEQYRTRVESGKPSAALLCRLGFFENTLAGNLEDSIGHYEQALFAAKTDAARTLARAEIQRLRHELAYITRWQAERLKVVHATEEKDLAAFLATRKLAERDEKIFALEEEKETIAERLAYLNDQQGGNQEALYTAMRRMTRYGRTYYDPNQNSDGAASGTFSPPGQATDIELYYANRRRVQENQDQIAQIRSEISGLQKRLKEIDKEIARLKTMSR